MLCKTSVSKQLILKTSHAKTFIYQFHSTVLLIQVRGVLQKTSKVDIYSGILARLASLQHIL